MKLERRGFLSVLLAGMLAFSGMPLTGMPSTQQTVRAEQETQSQLSAPQNLVWDGGYARWDAVSGASSYTVYLFEEGTLIKTFEKVGTNGLELYKWLNIGKHSYSFQVVANGSGYDPSEFGISPECTFSKTLPKMTGVKYRQEDETYIWDSFPEADVYDVKIETYDGRVKSGGGVHGGNYINLRQAIGVLGLPEGVYNIEIQAQKQDPEGFGWYALSGPYKGVYEYISTKPVLEPPENARWEGTVAKWESTEASYYQVNLFEEKTLIHSFVNCYTDSVDMKDYFEEGEHIYHFEVAACKSGNTISTWAVSPNLNYMNSLPKISGVSISSEGILSWDSFEAEIFEFRVGTFTGWVKGNSVDLKKICWENDFANGPRIVTLRAFNSENPEKRKQLSATWTGTYTYEADRPGPTKGPTITPTITPSSTPTPTPSGAIELPIIPIRPSDTPTPTPEVGATISPTSAPVSPTISPTSKPVAPTVSPTTEPTPTTDPDKEPTFEDFVERLYVVALNRASEPEGKSFWVNKVVNGEYNGADCARYFLLQAPEFMNRNLDNEDFLEVLYKTFYDRESDAAGKLYWEGRMKRGLPPEDVVNAFIESTEWCNVCATYGVKSGALYHKAEFASKNAIKFATRLYTCCLAREPEQKGLDYWSLALTNLEQTGCSAAKLFFTSTEFLNFKTSHAEYVKRLYRTFMGREPEASEVSYWTDALYGGTQTRASVMAFFGQSPEFTNICKKYGIDRGTI